MSADIHDQPFFFFLSFLITGSFFVWSEDAHTRVRCNLSTLYNLIQPLKARFANHIQHVESFEISKLREEAAELEATLWKLLVEAIHCLEALDVI